MMMMMMMLITKIGIFAFRNSQSTVGKTGKWNFAISIFYVVMSADGWHNVNN